MAEYTFRIGEGAQEFTFSSPRTQWTPGIDNTWNLAGFKDQEAETNLFEGLLRGADAEPTFDAWEELRQVAKRNSAQRLRVFIGTTLKLDLNPATTIAGPFIDFFRVDKTPGGFSNHVKFRLLVRAVTAGGGQFADNPEVSNVQRAIEVEDFNDRFQRKEWRATAGGDDALSLIDRLLSLGHKEFTVELAEQFLPVHAVDQYAKLAQTFLDADPAGAIVQTETILAAGVSAGGLGVRRRDGDDQGPEEVRRFQGVGRDRVGPDSGSVPRARFRGGRDLLRPGQAGDGAASLPQRQGGHSG